MNIWLLRLFSAILGFVVAVYGVYWWTHQGEVLRSLRDEAIVVTQPVSGAKVSSPLVVRGEVPGTWFFEASFPVTLTDWDGRIIAESIAQAKGDWMTGEYVPFEATLTFDVPPPIVGVQNRGSLILKKDNPSGLPQNDDSLEITVMF